jgi:hypothetical protein
VGGAEANRFARWLHPDLVHFGYSHTYKSILGAIHVICAALLLFRKTALLAAVVMVPMMINILLINIFYSIIRTLPPPLRLLNYETGHFICYEKRTFLFANDTDGLATTRQKLTKQQNRNGKVFRSAI